MCRFLFHFSYLCFKFYELHFIKSALPHFSGSSYRCLQVHLSLTATKSAQLSASLLVNSRPNLRILPWLALVSGSRDILASALWYAGLGASISLSGSAEFSCCLLWPFWVWLFIVSAGSGSYLNHFSYIPGCLVSRMCIWEFIWGMPNLRHADESPLSFICFFWTSTLN